MYLVYWGTASSKSPCILNTSAEEFVIEDGERIAQMVIAKHEQAVGSHHVLAWAL